MTEDAQSPSAPDLEADADALLAADQDEIITALQAEVVALKDQALRYLADAENTKRRAEREANDARAYAIQKFATSLLGVADTLGRALQHAPKESEDAAFNNFVLGIEMTQKELQGAFEKNGLKKIEPEPGDKFDPHQHQAVIQQETNAVPPGTVAAVMQAGYELMGRNVRPAMVAVATKGPEPANPYGGQTDDSGGSVDTSA